MRPAIVYECNTHRTRLDPAPVRAPVPQFQRGAGGGVRTLSVDEGLLLKGIFVHPRGRTQERLPFLRAAHDPRHGFPRQRGYGFFFPGHVRLRLIIISQGFFHVFLLHLDMKNP